MKMLKYDASKLVFPLLVEYRGSRSSYSVLIKGGSLDPRFKDLADGLYFYEELSDASVRFHDYMSPRAAEKGFEHLPLRERRLMLKNAVQSFVAMNTDELQKLIYAAPDRVVLKPLEYPLRLNNTYHGYPMVIDPKPRLKLKEKGYYRKCVHCGFEASNAAALRYFRKDSSAAFGYRNECKTCHKLLEKYPDTVIIGEYCILPRKKCLKCGKLILGMNSLCKDCLNENISGL